MPDNYILSVNAQMLIRKPAAEVYEAFVDPAITKHFWFTRSSGRLETGRRITWEWEMYNVSTTVLVKELLPSNKIVIDWGDPATTVEFNFQPVLNDCTYVTVRNYGFHQTGNELIEVIKDSTGGFTTVLDGLKAYLEHQIDLNLIRDKFPKEVTSHG